MHAGYSGTPLAKKLGVKDGQRTWRSAMPASVATEISQSGVSPILLKTPQPGLDMAHLFVTARADLSAQVEKAEDLPLSFGAPSQTPRYQQRAEGQAFRPANK
jgi:hypothetical protein